MGDSAEVSASAATPQEPNNNGIELGEINTEPTLGTGSVFDAPAIQSNAQASHKGLTGPLENLAPEPEASAALARNVKANESSPNAGPAQTPPEDGERNGFKEPAPAPEPSRNEWYWDYVDQLIKEFPQLGIIRGSKAEPRHYYIHVRIFDKGRETSAHAPYITDASMSTEQRQAVYRKLRSALHQFPESSNHRFVLVEDLNPITIQILGEIFDLEPEFFAQHMFNCAYGLSSDRFEDRPGYGNNPGELYPLEGTFSFRRSERPQNWNTGSMEKLYYSSTWYRPGQCEPIYPRRDQRDPRRWEYPDQTSAGPNIFRPHWRLTASLEADRQAVENLGGNQDFTLWEERQSISEVRIGKCKICKRSLSLHAPG